MNGPGGEGGAINLVSRKPTKEIELEGRSGMILDGDLGSGGQWSRYAYAGTRQKGYYAQLSGSIIDQDHFDMSNDFTPAGPGTLGFAQGIAEGFPYENGGNRDRSDNVYYNAYENTVSFFTNPAYTNQPVDSPYDDHSIGGFVEMGTDLIPMNTLKGAIHLPQGRHTEESLVYNYATTPTSVSVSGAKRQEEETWSFAVENTFHAAKWLDLVTGVSYDLNQVLEVVDPANPPVATPSVDAWNWQTAAIYSYSPTGKVHADVSSRIRFPTLFERYSTRFGTKVSDPNLPPERATNYEIGIDDALYHTSPCRRPSFTQTSIQNVFTAANSKTSIVGISPDGSYYGAELSADWDMTRTLRIGNYTYMQRHLDFADAAASAGLTGQVYDAAAATEIEGTPRHKAFLYAAWKPISKLTLTPSLELASNRVALVTSCASTLVPGSGPASTPISATTGSCNKPAPAEILPSYVNIGAYALLNFNAEYQHFDNTNVAVGATNLLDQNYELADGFPESGRQFYANARARF